MTDKAVSLEASDIFALGGSFIPQSSSTSVENSHAEMLKANGDFEKWSSVFNVLTNVTCPYKFNADTGLGAALPGCGEVKNGYIITEMAVRTMYNDYPGIDITGHNHAANAHADDRVTYSVSAAMQTLLTGALGAYDFAGLAADEVCATESTYTISVNHIDAECDEGNHWVGQNVQGLETCTVTYIGHIDTFTVSGWTVTGYTIDDSNEAFDTSSITFTKYLTRD